MPIGIGTGLAVAGGLGAVGAVGSGLIGANAAGKAADKQAQAAASALAYQKELFGTVRGDARADYAPYMNTGSAATYSLASLYGLPGANGQVNPPDYSQFYKTPDYQFALDQGKNATQNVLSAQGNLLSGSGLAALTNYGQGLASQQYGNYFNRLMSLANMGQTATSNYTSSMANLAGQQGAQVGNSMQAIGQAQASGIVGQANAYGGALQGATNSLSLPFLGAALGRNPSSYASGPTPINPMTGASNYQFGGGAGGGQGVWPA